jgi:hypothetical protein
MTRRNTITAGITGYAPACASRKDLPPLKVNPANRNAVIPASSDGKYTVMANNITSSLNNNSTRDKTRGIAYPGRSICYGSEK